jgi:hypothetical protein
LAVRSRLKLTTVNAEAIDFVQILYALEVIQQTASVILAALEPPSRTK